MGWTAGIHWLLDGREIDPRLVALLAAIDERGSLQQAVTTVGLSYRHAWALLGQLERRLGAPLVILERGRGARLTEYGQRLTAAHADLQARLAPALRHAASTLANHGPARIAIRLHASHDLALARFAELVNRRGPVEIDLRFQGSTDALAALVLNQCDIAGFHVPAELRELPLAYRTALRGCAVRVLRFAGRRQGLMLARGNPLRIRRVEDLVVRRARFVNRQRGSGTRILFDALLAAARLRPAQIHGYTHEEYTHAAVAAMVASGAADAGFGIEAAAVQQDLVFVPLAAEHYFLAARAAAWTQPGPRAVLAALNGRLLRTALRGLAGYDATAAGEPQDVRAALTREAPSTTAVKSRVDRHACAPQ